MPTDGSNFKRRLKFHGKTYTELRNGSHIDVVAAVSAAGLGRELAGDNPVKSLKTLVDVTIDCVSSIWARDRRILHGELSSRLNNVCQKSAEGSSPQIVKDSLIRAVGNLELSKLKIGNGELKQTLLHACGRDLHRALVIDYSDQYAAAHRSIPLSNLPTFLSSWERAADAHTDKLMKSIYDSGKPAKDLLTPGPKLTPMASDSLSDLTSSLINSS
jgi:hypothetical protein